MDKTLAEEKPAEQAHAENYEQKLVSLLDEYTHKELNRELIDALKRSSSRDESSRSLPLGTLPSLFRAYPTMGQRIPFVQRAQYPTPLLKITAIPALKNLYIKLGSKEIRKLDLLLGEAYRHHRKKVLAFGGLGSDYVVEAASYAQLLGMQAVCIYKAFAHEPKPDPATVRTCLELVLDTNAQIKLSEKVEDQTAAAAEEFQLAQKADGTYPYLIPAGGSCSLARIGAVNLIFELNEQVRTGEMAEPDIIVCTHGDIATGLYLGKKALKWKSRLLTFQMERKEKSEVLVTFVRDHLPPLNTLLREADSSFPIVDFIDAEFESINGLDNPDYVNEALLVQQRMRDEKIDFTLDTARSFASLVAYVEKNNLQDKTILFLNTTDIPAKPVNPPDLSRLPEKLRAYFE